MARIRLCGRQPSRRHRQGGILGEPGWLPDADQEGSESAWSAVFRSAAEIAGSIRREERKNMGWNARRHHSATIGFFAAFGLAVGYGSMAAAQAPYTIRYGV